MKARPIRENQLSLFDPAAMTADMVLDGLDDEIRQDAQNWPSLLADLVEVLYDHFSGRRGTDPEVSREVVQDIVVVIAHYLGGRAVYLPRDDRLKRAIRDALIYKAFDGGNHLALARQTGLTTTQIYNIISRQRRLKLDRVQMKLPFGDVD